jgi:hypothetical protein
MVEHERLARRRVEDERRPDEPAPVPQSALLALQRSAGNQAVRRMLARQHDPDFAYGPGYAEPTTIVSQNQLNDEVEDLIDDRYGGYRALFLQNDVATSAGSWRDLVFSYMEETYVLNGFGRDDVLTAVKAVKKKYRGESLLNMARVHVYWSGDGPAWSVDNLRTRLQDAGAYLDDDDEEALERIVETEGEFAQKKVEVAAGNLELIDEDEVVVLIDDHQNKHQVDKIAQFKAYTGDPGSKFASGKDLEWHRTTTAETVKETVEEAVRDGLVTPDGGNYSPSKDAIDGIIYDLTISYDPPTGKYVGSYHCNPVVDEFND